MSCAVQCWNMFVSIVGTSIVSISFLLKRGTVNSTGNGRDWMIASQHIQIACTLLAVKGRL